MGLQEGMSVAFIPSLVKAKMAKLYHSIPERGDDIYAIFKEIAYKEFQLDNTIQNLKE